MTDDANPGQLPEDAKGLRALYEAEIAAHKETKQQLNAMQGVAREHATLKAGLDLDDVKQTAFWAVHGTGELTPEALKATALKLGFASETPPPTPPQPGQPTPGQPAVPGTPDANDPPQRDPFGRPVAPGAPGAARINAASAGTQQGADMDFKSGLDKASGSKESIRDFLIQQGMIHTPG